MRSNRGEMDGRDEEHVHLVSSGRTQRLARRRKREVFCYCAVATVVSVVLLIGLGLAIAYGIPYESTDDNYSSGTYKHAAVAADAPQCSKVGVDILKKDGSAVDAAIASLLCVGVVNFHSTGIGGGGFMVYYNATSKTATTFDYRETAPGRANSSLYKPFGPNENASLYGGFQVATSSRNKLSHSFSMCVCRWSGYCSAWGTEGAGASTPEVRQAIMGCTVPASCTDS